MKKMLKFAMAASILLISITISSGCKKSPPAHPEACIASVAATINVNTPFTFKGCTKTIGATYLWDFGDGLTSTADSGSHFYSYPGSYTITLTVTNANGTSTTTQTITVTNPAGKVKMEIITSYNTVTTTVDTLLYTYDQQGRMASFSSTISGGYFASYTYGNGTITVTPSVDPPSTSTLNSRGYVDNDRGTSFQYDSAGYLTRVTTGNNVTNNIISDGNKTKVVYNGQNLPTDTVQYTYLAAPDFTDRGDRFNGKGNKNLVSTNIASGRTYTFTYNLDSRGVVLSAAGVGSDGSTSLITYTYY